MATSVATGMMVEIHRESFLAALNAVAGVCPSKSPKPILQNVKFVAGGMFETGDDGPALWATDLELSIRRLVGGVKVIEPGSMILNPVRLKEILSRADCADLTLESDGETIKIRGKKVKYDLPSEDPDLFPMPPSFDAKAYHVVQAADLRRLIARTRYATDVESTRYALGGLLTELHDGSITMVGTDGRRIAEAKAPAGVVGEPGDYVNGDKAKPAPVLSLKMVNLLYGSLKDKDPEVHLSIDHKSSAIVRTEKATIYGRLVEGRFPRYQDIYASTDYEADLTVKVGILRRVAEQARVTTSEESRGVDFTFSAGRLVLISQTADMGKSEAETEIDYDGPNVEVTFDPQYLLDPLAVLDDDTRIRLQPSKMGVNRLETEDGYTCGIMPLTRDR